MNTGGTRAFLSGADRYGKDLLAHQLHRMVEMMKQIVWALGDAIVTSLR
jgi:hypothetical protein